MVGQSIIEKIHSMSVTMVATREKELKDATAQLSQVSEQCDLYEKAVEVFRSVSTNRRDQLKQRLERLLSYGLTSVFDEKLAVTISYRSWGKSDRVSIMVSDGGPEKEIYGFRGGGLVEVLRSLIKNV